MRAMNIPILLILTMTAISFLMILVFMKPIVAVTNSSNNQSKQSDKNALPYFNKIQMYNRAVEYYNKALATDPNNSDVLINKGIVLIKLDKYNDALKLFDKALNINSHNAGALYNKGISLDKLGRHGEAAIYYRNAYRIDPNYNGQFINIISESPSISLAPSSEIEVREHDSKDNYSSNK